jgi:hypothetical protein
VEKSARCCPPIRCFLDHSDTARLLQSIWLAECASQPSRVPRPSPQPRDNPALPPSQSDSTAPPPRIPRSVPGIEPAHPVLRIHQRPANLRPLHCLFEMGEKDALVASPGAASPALVRLQVVVLLRRDQILARLPFLIASADRECEIEQVFHLCVGDP